MTCTTTIPLNQINIAILDIHGSAQLIPHMHEICGTIHAKYSVPCSIAFIWDKQEQPQYQDAWLEGDERDYAKNIFAHTSPLCTDGAICFKSMRGWPLPCFDLIDYVLEYEVCQVFSNVTRLNAVSFGSDRILILGYDNIPA